jgi:hypothetical protein
LKNSIKKYKNSAANKVLKYDAGVADSGVKLK